MSEKDSLEQRRHALEEQFFKKEEERKLKEYKDELERKTTREELAEASGMTDDAVLDELVKLGISAKTVTALSLVPLIRVAWADGKIQDNERRAILQAAEGKGIDKDSAGSKLLEDWLDREPGEELFEAWKHYVSVLKAELTGEQAKTLKRQVVDFAGHVAKVAGGFLGLASVSEAEKKALDEIGAAFDA